jgi:hypothetical protein
MNNILKRLHLIALLGVGLGTVSYVQKTHAAGMLRGIYTDVWTNGIRRNLTSAASSIAINGGTFAVGAGAYVLAGKLFGFVPVTVLGVGGLAAYYIAKKGPDAFGKWAEDTVKDALKIAGLPAIVYGYCRMTENRAPSLPPHHVAGPSRINGMMSGVARNAESAWSRAKWPMAAAAAAGATIVALKKYVFTDANNRRRPASAPRTAAPAHGARSHSPRAR